MTTSSPATIESSALSVATVTGPGAAAVCSISSHRPAGRSARINCSSSAGEPESREFSSRRRGSASLSEGSVGESESPRIRAFRGRNRPVSACLAGEQAQAT
jgi:hypothetical protein